MDDFEKKDLSDKQGSSSDGENIEKNSAPTGKPDGFTRPNNTVADDYSSSGKQKNADNSDDSIADNGGYGAANSNNFYGNNNPNGNYNQGGNYNPNGNYNQGGNYNPNGNYNQGGNYNPNGNNNPNGNYNQTGNNYPNGENGTNGFNTPDANKPNGGANYYNKNNGGNGDNTFVSGSSNGNGYYGGNNGSSYFGNTSGNSYYSGNAELPDGVNQKPSNGKSIASMVLGIISIIGCCAWYISLILAIAGLVLGIISQKKNPNGYALAGIITSCFGIVFGIIIAISAMSFDWNAFLKQYEQLLSGLSDQSSSRNNNNNAFVTAVRVIVKAFVR